MSALPAIKTFEQSRTAAERKYVAGIVRKSDMTNNQKEALRFILNMWFRHRNESGVIYFGADLMAKRCGFSPRTAKTMLKLFRDNEWIEATKYAKGGRKSTRYVVSLDKVKHDLDPVSIVVIQGELERVEVENSSRETLEVVRENRAKIARDYNMITVAHPTGEEGLIDCSGMGLPCADGGTWHRARMGAHGSNVIQFPVGMRGDV